MPNPTITVEQAQARLTQALSTMPVLQDASIVHASTLDCAGFYAFSVTAPNIVGGVVYLVDDTHILSSGQPETTFQEIMKRMNVGRGEQIPDVYTFARLFLHLRALQPGIVLNAPDGHVLLRPGQLPASIFSAPKVEVTAQGTHYSFWVFDTTRYIPVFWDVWIATDNSVSIQMKEL